MRNMLIISLMAALVAGDAVACRSVSCGRPTIVYGTTPAPRNDNAKALAVAALGLGIIAILIALEPAQQRGQVRIVRF
jgi:hypothetical protein